MDRFFKVTENGIVLNVRVLPNSSKSCLVGLELLNQREYLKIKLSSPPIDNKANLELLKFLSKQFKIPKSKMQILKGEHSREKTIFLCIEENLFKKYSPHG